MFATGGTAIDAVKFLREKGVKEIKFISIIAAPEGLKRFSEIYPDVEVYTASIDEKLNEKTISFQVLVMLAIEFLTHFKGLNLNKDFCQL